MQHLFGKADRPQLKINTLINKNS